MSRARFRGVREIAARPVVVDVSLFQIGIEWIPLEDVLPRAARLSLELRHPAYDCIYLATALVLGVVFATGDERLRRLAREPQIPLDPATLKGRA